MGCRRVNPHPQIDTLFLFVKIVGTLFCFCKLGIELYSDGSGFCEKALIDGFKRNFRFATFLRCFIHFKDNIKRELSDRGFNAGEKQQFLEEIFGRRDGTVKFLGLVDSDSEDEFDAKLESLKET